MIAGFNAFQLLCCLVSGPFLIGWLYTATFPFAIAAFSVAIGIWVVLFVFCWLCLWDAVASK